MYYSHLSPLHLQDHYLDHFEHWPHGILITVIYFNHILPMYQPSITAITADRKMICQTHQV